MTHNLSFCTANPAFLVTFRLAILREWHSLEWTTPSDRPSPRVVRSELPEGDIVIKFNSFSLFLNFFTRQRQIDGIRNYAVPMAIDDSDWKQRFEQADNIYMRESGILAQSSIAEVDARVLPTPVILLAHDSGSNQHAVEVNIDHASFFDPTNGSNVMSVKCARLANWAGLIFSNWNFDLSLFLDCLYEVGQARLSSIPPPRAVRISTPEHSKTAYDRLKMTVFYGAKPHLLMIIITPHENSQEYAACRQCFDVIKAFGPKSPEHK